MTMSSSRPFANPGFPASPSLTTASSLNYSQYGGNSFASPSRRGPPSATSSYSSRANGTPRQGTGLRPSLGGGNGSSGAKPDSREIARVHFRALSDYLREWIEKEPPTARASAREKLTRLTKLQFQELSTDVYDELLRRLDADRGPNGAAPFLPVRDEFHPKRNQARQKLATLPKNRFRDLASDVFFELRRRFPGFEEEEGERETMYDDDPPPAPGPTNRPPYYRDRSGGPPAIPNLDSLHQRQGSRNASGSSSRSRPSRDGTSHGDGFGSGPANYTSATNDTVIPNKSRMREEDVQVPYSRDSQQPMQSSGGAGMLDRPTNDVVIPNKSRMREEKIEVPFSRDSAVDSGPGPSSGGGGMVDRPTNDVVVPNKSRMREEEIEVPYAQERPRSSTSSRHSRSSSVPDRTPRGEDPRHPQNAVSPQTDDRDYFDRISFSSNVTSKSRPGGAIGGAWDDEKEKKIRSDYEFRIAGLERKVSVADAEREDLRKAEGDWKSRCTGLEVEIKGLKDNAATHASNLRSMQHELDLARDKAETARSHGDSSSRQAQEDVAQAQDEAREWRARSEQLEEELRRSEDERRGLETLGSMSAGMGGEQAVDQLKDEIHNLMDELQALSMRNENLMGERERDAQALNDMEAKVEEYKKLYDSVRVELRNMKATSVMFVPKPATDDHLPASPDGNIADINVLAFQTAIDGLLSAARSSAPSGVLSSMKAIVEAVTEIGDDVKQFELRPNLDVDVSRLEHLKFESTNRLNSLMQAARSHAMSSGLSPVSLIDAAAGHLSSNVVEIVKLLKIRRSGTNGMPRNRSSMSIKDMVDRSRGTGTPTDLRRGAGTPTEGRSARTYTPNDLFSGRSGSPAEVSYSGRATPTESKLSSSYRSNLNNGPEERLRDLPASNSMRRLADLATRTPEKERTLSPIETRFNNGPVSGSGSALRVNSYQSSASSVAKSDAFDLDRKPSITESRPPTLPEKTPAMDRKGSTPTSKFTDGLRTVTDPGKITGGLRSVAENLKNGAEGFRNGYKHGGGPALSSARSDRTGDGASSMLAAHSPLSNGNTTASLSAATSAVSSSRSPMGGYGFPKDEEEVFALEGGTEEEWEEVKPYLEGQSSALVNAIQNLLAAIRTGGATPALNEHLSEVIAIASSIVAVSTNALPTALRHDGNPLLKDLVENTNNLSEAQEQAKGGAFDKNMRQVIASASFGVAKSLKALMKLGSE